MQTAGRGSWHQISLVTAQTIYVKHSPRSSLEALLACRLMPLDKNPGLRSIGIHEVLRQIASKVVVSHIREDIILAVGLLWVCAGQEIECESLVHAIHEVYEDQSSGAVLLVDASNAFNSINRNVFLHITIICRTVGPSLAASPEPLAHRRNVAIWTGWTDSTFSFSREVYSFFW